MRKYVLAALVSLVCTIFSFSLHVLPSVNSTINLRTSKVERVKPFISNEHLIGAVAYHKEHPAFAKRPLTTYFVEKLSEISNLDIGESFTFINFFLLFVCGILIHHYSLLIGNSITEATISIITFYLSFSILFAFFPPVYSYDEPLQYVCILLSLIALFHSDWFFYIISFSLALVTRESTAILLIGIPLITAIPLKLTFSNFKKGIFLSMPLLIYIVYLFIFIKMNSIETASKQDFSNRLSHFYGNFRNMKFTIETISSFLLAVGFQSYILFSYKIKSPLTTIESRLYKAFIVTLIINTVVVLLTTSARETRLFTLPLLFIFPFLGKIVIDEFRFIKTKLLNTDFKSLSPYLSSILIFSAFTTFISYKYYFQTIGSQADNFFNEYIVFVASLFFSHFVFRFVLNPKHTPPSLD